MQATTSPLDCTCISAVGALHASGACFSRDRRYRYGLWRETFWGEPRVLMVVMLNPSTADETDPDATITRVTRYATKQGFNRLLVANAFALVSTDPRVLVADPLGAIGPSNDAHLGAYAKLADHIVLGWGANLERYELAFRRITLQSILGNYDAHAWKRTKNGSPGHPLYISAKVVAEPFVW